MIKIIFLSISLGVLFSCNTINADRHDIPEIKQKISIERLPVCYNHSCSVVGNIQLSKKTWQTISSFFSRNNTDFDERLAIRRSVALLEQEAALHTPVGADLAKNTNLGEVGRQDCVDESTNTTHFLTLLQNTGLLQWHKVGSRVYRTHVLLDQHYAAQIIHLNSGQRYVVDSWYLANGEQPYIQPYRRWVFKQAFLKQDNPI